jgi:DNA-binding CsgD family transcriptional regulator
VNDQTSSLAQFQIPTRITGRPVLTERELAVLVGMSFGHSNAQMGRKMLVTEDTVKSHVRTLFKKLGTNDRPHATRVGLELGFLVSSLADVPPTEVTPAREASGFLPSYPEYARWGGFIPGTGEEPDPVPAVFSCDNRGGEVEVGDYRLSLDVAEALAARIVAAVRYQRGRAGAVDQP